MISEIREVLKDRGVVGDRHDKIHIRIEGLACYCACLRIQGQVMSNFTLGMSHHAMTHVNALV
jgi:hypothetical protein